jgi:excisionase family DNA binding protein
MVKQGKGDQVMEATVVEPAYLNYAEAERFTGLHRVTIWRAVRQGELKASGGGRGVRFSRDELRRWMESR